MLWLPWCDRVLVARTLDRRVRRISLVYKCCESDLAEVLKAAALSTVFIPARGSIEQLPSDGTTAKAKCPAL